MCCSLSEAGEGVHVKEDRRSQICQRAADRKANTFCAYRLVWNNLGPEGGAALAEGLKGNSTLTSLS